MSKYTDNENWILKTLLRRFYTRKADPILSHSFTAKRDATYFKLPFKLRVYVCSVCDFEISWVYVRDVKVIVKGFIIDDAYSCVKCDEIAMNKALL